MKQCQKELGDAYIHDIVKHDKRSPFCLLLTAYPNLTDAAVAPKEVVQILAGDLVVQVLHEEDAVRAWGKLRLERARLQNTRNHAKGFQQHTVGLGTAMSRE